jgi:hypothetical protein
MIQGYTKDAIYMPDSLGKNTHIYNHNNFFYLSAIAHSGQRPPHCRELCVLSGRDLCDELITRPEESYRLLCVVVCEIEIS